MKKSIAAALIVLTVSGCATTATVIPQAGGIYKTIAYGASKRAALDSALHAAGNECTNLQKRFEVLDQSEEYLSALPEVVNKVANTFLLLDGSEDYRTTLSFTCV